MIGDFQLINDFIIGNDVSSEQKKKRFSLAYDVFESMPKIIDQLKNNFTHELYNEIQSLSGWLTEDWVFEQPYAGYLRWYKKEWIIGKSDAVYSLCIEPMEKGVTYGVNRCSNRFTTPSEETIFAILNKRGFTSKTTWWVACLWKKPSFYSPESLMNILEKGSPDYKDYLQKALVPVKQLSNSVENDNLDDFISTAANEYQASQDDKIS